MMIRVNKNTGTKPQNVKYAALSTGTVSAVWYDDDTAASASPKRQNRIKLSTLKDAGPAKPDYDA